jgi:hypothetical protein
VLCRSSFDVAARVSLAVANEGTVRSDEVSTTSRVGLVTNKAAKAKPDAFGEIVFPSITHPLVC